MYNQDKSRVRGRGQMDGESVPRGSLSLTPNQSRRVNPLVVVLLFFVLVLSSSCSRSLVREKMTTLLIEHIYICVLVSYNVF